MRKIYYVKSLFGLHASLCCFQHLSWLIHEPFIPVSLITMWAGTKRKLLESSVHTVNFSFQVLGILMNKRLHCFYTVCIFYLHDWYNTCSSWKGKCIVWADRNRMGGFVRTGAHMLVNLQAGNCTGIDAKHRHCPQYTPNFVTRPPQHLMQYFLLVLLLTLLCFSLCLQSCDTSIAPCTTASAKNLLKFCLLSF